MKEVPMYHTFSLSHVRYRKQYAYDTLLAAMTALIGTITIYRFELYLSFTHILLIYIPLVLMIAVFRGLYASLLASLLASIATILSFIPDPFALTFANGEKWISLLLLSFVAGVAGELTSQSRRITAQAKRQAREMILLYQLVESIGNTESPESQLQLVANAIVDVFHPWGVAMCTFFIFTTEGNVSLRADAPQLEHTPEWNLEEESTMNLTIRTRQMQMVHDAQHLAHTSGNHYIRFPFSSSSEERYIYFVPLVRGQDVIAILRLVSKGVSPLLSVSKDPIATFFQTFLDQAMSVIERTQLQAEKLHAETWRQTDALRTSLIHLVSHDLRTPLSTIKVAASTLYKIGTGRDDTTLKTYASNIEQEADRLNHLVGNLLDMSRIEGNVLRVETVLFPMDTLIYETVGQMGSLLQSRVKIHIPENLPPVDIEPTRIEQVLRNLLENAVRYTPSELPIEISACVDNKYMMVCIRDYGPGIAQSDIEHIFDKFYYVEKHRYNTSLPPGSGLGLAICRGLIEAHGGKIWADNHIEGGAIFSFSLPVKEGEEYA